MTEIGERVDGRIRDLADLCSRHGTPCADGLLAEIGRLRTELEHLRAEWQFQVDAGADLFAAKVRAEADAERWHDAWNQRGTVADMAVRHVRTELGRTEGDLGVAIREAAAARETLQAMRPLLAHVNDSVPTIGIPAALRLIDAALDQRLTPGETEESPDDPAVMLSLIDDQADEIESLHGRIAGQANTINHLRVVVSYAGRVMEALEAHGPDIVGHLLDTDDNDGQRLREALRDVSL